MHQEISNSHLQKTVPSLPPHMKARDTQIEHLTLKSIDPVSRRGERPGKVLIVGNAYGVMPYQPVLGDALATEGFETSWFAFSGQEGTAGVYSVETAVRDLGLVIDHLSGEGSASLRILAHCAGSIMVTEYLLRHGGAAVEQLAIYGLLFKPSRRRAKAEPLLQRCGVRQAIEEYGWNYPWREQMPRLETPILLCHARDDLNLERATEEEIDLAAHLAKDCKLKWFERGYDRDLEMLPEFVQTYVEWFRVASVPTSAP